MYVVPKSALNLFVGDLGCRCARANICTVELRLKDKRKSTSSPVCQLLHNSVSLRESTRQQPAAERDQRGLCTLADDERRRDSNGNFIARRRLALI